MPTMLIRKSRPELFVKILMMDMPMMPNSPNRAMLPTLDRSMRVADPISDMARNMPAEATNAIVMSPFVYTIKMEDNVSPFTAAYVRNRSCLLYTSDAADDLLCVDLGGRRIIKKKK